MSWTPLFSEITESSIWDEAPHVRLAWITFLAKKDYREHTYEVNPYLLSRAANITEEQAEDAMRVLSSPDRRSRNQDSEGRRILNLGGNLYQVLSGKRYSDKMRAEKKRIADRERISGIRRSKAELENSVSPDAGVVFSEKAIKLNPPGILDKTRQYEAARPILHLLNELTGSHFREVDANLSLISARLSEPEVTPEGVKTMITRIVSRWKNDPKMAPFLRPATLFGKEKFDSYYATKDQPLDQISHTPFSEAGGVPAWLQKKNLLASLSVHPGNDEKIGSNPTDEERKDFFALKAKLTAMG